MFQLCVCCATCQHHAGGICHATRTGHSPRLLHTTRSGHSPRLLHAARTSYSPRLLHAFRYLLKQPISVVLGDDGRVAVGDAHAVEDVPHLLEFAAVESLALVRRLTQLPAGGFHVVHDEQR